MKSHKITDFSPLRYPGSKQKILKYLEEILSYNSLNPDILIEPFVGGGNVFLYFINYGLANKAIISDKDSLIFSFWKTVFEDPDSLIKFILETKINLETYYYYKQIMSNIDHYETLELAQACIFLNRTSFSGIMTHSTGPIGGKNQKSKYKIDCRFNRQSLVEKIQFISTLNSKVDVLNLDWKMTIKRTEKKYAKTTNQLFYYLDPPFFVKAKDLYRIFFTNDEHLRLSKYLYNFNRDWILSYDNVPEIIKLYSNDSYYPIHINMPYSINSKSNRIEKELIITPLELPNHYNNKMTE